MILQLLISAFLIAPVEYVAYTSPEKDYSFEINGNATYEREPDKTGGYTDNFEVVHDTTSKIIDYSIVVTKATIGEKITIDVIQDPSVKDSFQANCSCVVNDSKKTSYKNLTGILYTFTKKNEANLKLIGTTFMIPKDENLYSFTFMASEADYAKYKDEYTHTINSMEIFK